MEKKDPQTIVGIIREAYPQALGRTYPVKDAMVVEVKKEFLLELSRFLHDDPRLNFDYLSFVTAIDYPDNENRFEVVYQLYSVGMGHKLRMKVPVDEYDAEVASVTPVWESAHLLEMEVYDMFGIVFTNHPDLRRIYMPEDWDGHPLRKDYPLRGYN